MVEKRLIDSDEKQIIIQALKMHHDSQFTPGVYEHSVFGKAALLLESTVDAVEFIRCEQCACNDRTDNDKRSGIVWCNKICRYMKADGFCSEGERRTQ